MKMFKSTFILFTVTLTIGFLLGFINKVVQEPISIQEEKALKENMIQIFPEADDFIEEIISDENISLLYTAVHEGVNIGYLIETRSMGYGGYIATLTGIYSDGAIAGVRITSHAETPGLGANIENDDFLSQYEGADQPLVVVKLNPAPNEIEAITSATISTDAVTEGVNKAIAFFNSTFGGIMNE